MNDRAMQILKYIERCTNERGSAPTIREIGVEFDIASTNGVRYYLTMLEKARLVKRTSKRSRGTISMARSARHEAAAGIPVLGRIAAGSPILAEGNQEGTLSTEQVFGDPAGLFALRVRGDSMIDAGILEGDYVIVRSRETANPGEIIVALLEDEATVKYYRPQRDHIDLVAANSNYEPIHVDKDSGFRIAGVVAGVVRTIGR
jgi:repressor LexA